MTKIRLRFVQAFTAHGKPYYYFRKPGCARIKLPGLPGSADFMDAYQTALAASAPPSDIGAKRSSPGTVNALVALYANSSQFKHEIAAETRRTMWAILRRFGDEHGGKRVALLRREHLLAILDGRPPFARRNWLRALRPLLDFAVSIKWIAENPANDIKAKIPRKGEGFRAWGEEQIAAFRQHHAFGTRARLALELLLNTTQRRSDVGVSYGLSLLIHTVTVVVSWRQLFDPWGLAKVGSHLWVSTWPTWGGFAALFLMREWDTWTLDGWRQSRSGLLPTDQAV